VTDALKRIEEKHKPTPIEIGEGYSYQTTKFTGCAECGDPHPCDVVKLARALEHLLNAVTFGPESDLSPGNPGYAARIPIGFVDDAKRTLEEVAGE